MKNTDLLTHSEKNQQADRLWAGKSGYYEMNAVSFLSCCLKMEKTHSKDFPPRKTKQKYLQKYLTAHVRGLKMTPKNAFNFRHFVLHFLITQLTEVSLPYI